MSFPRRDRQGAPAVHPRARGVAKSRATASGPSRHNLPTRTWVTARNHRRITAPQTRTFNHGAALGYRGPGLLGPAAVRWKPRPDRWGDRRAAISGTPHRPIGKGCTNRRSKHERVRSASNGRQTRSSRTESCVSMTTTRGKSARLARSVLRRATCARATSRANCCCIAEAPRLHFHRARPRRRRQARDRNPADRVSAATRQPHRRSSSRCSPPFPCDEGDGAMSAIENCLQRMAMTPVGVSA